ncbi:MAG: CofH family radical SAM protein [Phycisphaerales bacterium]|nr:MAG: CofH family radical SAM protein [Phycisphaerales bacterium]
MATTEGQPSRDIRYKLDAGKPLTLEDGVRLYESRDIHTLGELANNVRERLHGRMACYNINLHINYTNYCVLRCKFCSFYRPYPKGAAGFPGASGHGHSESQDLADSAHDNAGYELSIDEIVAQARGAYARGATEVHITGGLHPALPFTYYTDMCNAIRETCPHIHIKAFTAIEIIHFARISKPRLSIGEILTHLWDAGLGSLPGGGAEIFDDRVHDEAFKTKVGEAEWFEVHSTAHELGIFTNATMLYGHVETPAERIKHLIKLREHQKESLRSRKAHFNCVVPLSFVPEGSALSHLPGPSGLDDLKTLAISRLMCPNIPHIKAFWIMQTPKLAQVSLNWGVDDIDGTVVYYDITKREGGGTTRQELTVEKLRRLIVEAGCKPVERDSLYRPVIRDENTWCVEGQPWSVTYSPSPA